MTEDTLNTLLETIQSLASGDLNARPPLPLAGDSSAEARLASALHHLAETMNAREAENRRSKAELQEFVYIASHDLQEPLRKVISFADLLKEECAASLPADGVTYLDRMQLAALRMQALIQGLLNYSRVTTQAKPFAPVDLGRLLADLTAEQAGAVQRNGVVLTIGPLPVVAADGAQLRQLFGNLLDNALKFHRPGIASAIAVQAEEDAAEVRITVADNGIGFEQHYADRIFGMFQRLHGRGEYDGVGIGLALCRKIAERHGGAITAAAAAGQGAAFTVRLPKTGQP